MATHSKQDIDRVEHSLAQLIVHSPTEDLADRGPDVSMEELAAFSEGRLSQKRREQVLVHLDTNQQLYETWLNMELDTEQLKAFANAEYVRSNSSLIESLQVWLKSLFSWQGALSASFGLVVGVLAILITNENPDLDNSMNTQPMLTLKAPVTSPAKANLDTVQYSALTQGFLCTQLAFESICVSKTPSLQHWFYIDKNQTLSAIEPPLQYLEIKELRASSEKLIVISSDDLGQDNLNIFHKDTLDSGVILTLEYDFLMGEDTQEPKNISIKHISETEIEFMVILKDGDQKTIQHSLSKTDNELQDNQNQ